MKVLFAGGGTLGPVTPLLAVLRALRRQEPSIRCAWAGTTMGPERRLIEAERVPFHCLPIVKLPRYASLFWFALPFNWWRARRQAQALITDLQPDAIVSMGGLTAVPIVLTAAKRGIPCFIHQLDYRPGLANRRIARYCRITTSFAYPSPPFGRRLRTQQLPTPTWLHPNQLPDRHSACRFFGLNPQRPVVLVFGGGTGAKALNDLVIRTYPCWSKLAQVLHVTGQSKVAEAMAWQQTAKPNDYVVREFLDQDMATAYAASDLAICRSGMGSISELVTVGIPMILVPIPGSQQQDNADFFCRAGGAVVVSQTAADFDQRLWDQVERLLANLKQRRTLVQRAQAVLVTDDGTALAAMIRAGVSSTAE